MLCMWVYTSTPSHTQLVCVQLHNHQPKYREGRKNQKAKRLILDAAMAFLEPFTSRPNLQRRLNEHFSNENKAAAAAQAGSSSQ